MGLYLSTLYVEPWSNFQQPPKNSPKSKTKITKNRQKNRYQIYKIKKKSKKAYTHFNFRLNFMTIHHIKQNQKDIAKYDTIKYFVEDFKIGIDFLGDFW